METKAAVIAIIVENTDRVESLNGILHEYAQYIIGRMGLPYRQKNINIISVAIDASHEIINALSEKVGKLDGVNVKTVYSH